MEKKIKELAIKYNDLVIDYRRDIHKYPELGHKEIRTAKKVAEILKQLGIEVMTEVGKTGVVGIIRGKKEGNVIALRADMDALPIKEQTDLPFSSRNDGVMHACGHDMHTAILLGTAHILNEIKHEFDGTIKLIFQPAEENSPNGGAKYMIEDGVLDHPKVDCMLGLHVWTEIETGKIGCKPGSIMSASDRIFIKVKGNSAHGSMPHEGVDAGVIAAQVITALQTIVSRNIDSLDSCVISIGKINGGYRYNVVPDEMILEGTVRNLNPEVRKKIPERMGNLIKGIVEGMGGKFEFEYVPGYPPLVNDINLEQKIRKNIQNIMGIENFIQIEKPSLGGEDFAFFAKKVPAVYMFLGCRPKGIPINDFPTIHNPQFNPDEGALKIGIESLSNMVYDLLRG
ncbi:amidohydrolase [Lutibacter sp. B2]|nr:amidohydrolase [Lutibacter sp. B2]